MSYHRFASPCYVASGRAPVGGLIVLVLCGLLTGALLSPIYISATWFISFIYLRNLATIGYGYALGMVARFVVGKQHLRAPGKVMACTLLIGLGAVWLQWVFFFTFFFTRNGSSLAATYPALLLNPDMLWALIVELSEHGHFTVGESSSSAPVSGFSLILVWVVEAGLFTILPMVLAYTRAKKPYSEATSRWATETPVEAPLRQLPDHELRAALEAGDLSQLVPTDDQVSFARAELHQVEEDPACCFLTLKYVDVTTNAKGERKERERFIVTHLRILPQEANRLREMAPLAREAPSDEPAPGPPIPEGKPFPDALG